MASAPTTLVSWVRAPAASATGVREALHARGIELCFAELKDPVKDKLKRFGLYAQLGESHFFPTLGSAVSRYLEVNNVEWEDWEDQEKVVA